MLASGEWGAVMGGVTRHPILLRLPEELHCTLTMRAEREGVTRHALLLRLLEAGLENEELWREELRGRLRGLI